MIWLYFIFCHRIQSILKLQLRLNIVNTYKPKVGWGVEWGKVLSKIFEI